MRRGLRKAGWWLLSPFAYGTARLALHSGRQVLTGPFAGMRYPASFVPRLLFPGPYQVGSFELELQPLIERIVADAPEAIVNVGSAEGYYATGLAMRLPEATVIGFEADPNLRAAAAELAALNGVGGRIEIRGLCTIEELAALAPRRESLNVSLIMDCEGCESALADPEAVPWLTRGSMLIELHPAIDDEVRARLTERLSATHEVELIASQTRRASLFDAQLGDVRGLRRIDRELLVAEYRDGSQDWISALPRT